jgi:disulfide bond formation protein DsbB
MFNLSSMPVASGAKKGQNLMRIVMERRGLGLRNEIKAALFVGCVSAALLLGALIFQYWGGLAPCEMCLWQRWPHGAAILFGLIGGLLLAGGIVPPRMGRALAVLAIVAIAVSGAIGVFHAGVEWKFWPGPSECTGIGYVPGADDFKPLRIVRCDEAQWRLLGISLAGYNAIFSFGCALVGLSLLRRRRHA